MYDMTCKYSKQYYVKNKLFLYTLYESLFDHINFVIITMLSKC